MESEGEGREVGKSAVDRHGGRVAEIVAPRARPPSMVEGGTGGRDARLSDYRESEGFEAEMVRRGGDLLEVAQTDEVQNLSLQQGVSEEREREKTLDR